jgi:hypothetical protein
MKILGNNMAAQTKLTRSAVTEGSRRLRSGTGNVLMEWVELGVAGPNVLKTRDIKQTFITKLTYSWFVNNLLWFRYFTHTNYIYYYFTHTNYIYYYFTHTNYIYYYFTHTNYIYIISLTQIIYIIISRYLNQTLETVAMRTSVRVGKCSTPSPLPLLPTRQLFHTLCYRFAIDADGGDSAK